MLNQENAPASGKEAGAAGGHPLPDEAPNLIQTEAFLAALNNGCLQLASIHPRGEGPVRTHMVNGNIASTLAWVSSENKTRSIYFQPNRVRPGLDKKAEKSDIAAIVFAQVDIDPPKDGSSFDFEAVVSKLKASACPPSIITFSGGGVQAFWRLDDPTTDFGRVEAVSKAIAGRFGGDHCHAINHLMRVPGTINWPTPKKEAAGRKPALATILEADNGSTFSLEELEQAFPPVEDQATVDREKVQIASFELLTAGDLGLDAFDPLRAVIDHPSGADGSRDALLCAGDMMRAGFSKEQVAGILLNPANAVSAHCLGSTNPRRAAFRAIGAVWQETARDGAGAQSASRAGSTTGNDRDPTSRPSSAGGGTKDVEPLDLIDAADWDGIEPPPREWSIKNMVPSKLVTLFTGVGSAGKSLLGQQMATAVASGKRFLRASTSEVIALYATFEDDSPELHARQAKINPAYSLAASELRGKLFLAALAHLREKGLVRFDQHNRMFLTALFEQLKRTIEKHGVGFLVLDNVAHIFEGNEISRAHVAGFLGVLHALALETGCTIVLIAHPNKAGDSYSGSTAFQNQVRSQIALEVDPDDRDRRFLRRVKANYAPNGEDIVLRWHNGVFLPEEDIPPGENTAASIREAAANGRFFACLDTRNRQERPVSASKNASTYAPREFAAMSEAQGMTVIDFERAMERLFGAGEIETGELDFDKPNSRGHRAQGIRRATRRGGGDEPF